MQLPEKDESYEETKLSILGTGFGIFIFVFIGTVFFIGAYSWILAFIASTGFVYTKFRSKD